MQPPPDHDDGKRVHDEIIVFASASNGGKSSAIANGPVTVIAGAAASNSVIVAIAPIWKGREAQFEEIAEHARGSHRPHCAPRAAAFLQSWPSSLMLYTPHPASRAPAIRSSRARAIR